MSVGEFQHLYLRIDEDGDWTAEFDDVGTDGIGPFDEGYNGPDADSTQGNESEVSRSDHEVLRDHGLPGPCGAYIASRPGKSAVTDHSQDG